MLAPSSGRILFFIFPVREYGAIIGFKRGSFNTGSVSPAMSDIVVRGPVPCLENMAQGLLV